jgi:hypothetical protein
MKPLRQAISGAGHFQALAALQRGDELAGVQQAVVRAGVQPGVAAPHDLDVELALLQVGVVDGGDLQLAARAGLDRLGDVHHLAVVKVQPGDGVVAARLFGLFLDADGAPAGVELDHAVALGVVHVVGKHRGALAARVGIGQQGLEVVAVEQVVAQHQRAGRAADKALADDEGLRQAVGAGLHGVLQVGCPTGCRRPAVAESAACPAAC